MSLSIGGMSYKKVNEQARRISGCSLTNVTTVAR
jgi:hypothetical protein